MELIRGLHNIQPQHQGCVATIGNFDGVHLGHQAVLGKLRTLGAQYSVPTLVMVFEPQPKELFDAESAPSRLQTLAEKTTQLANQGIDRLLVVPFNQRFRSLTAQQFIDLVLIQQLGVKGLIVGDDFRFGCDRSGDYQYLQAASRQHGFELQDTQTHQLDATRVSSTRVREALLAYDFSAAAKLLGRRFTICGKVSHGQKLGRQLGTPTANILLKRHKLPLAGVFAVKGQWQVENQSMSAQGVANIGMRPTVNGIAPVFEVHFLDLAEDQQDLYGKRIDVEFVKAIRQEKKFSGLDELKQAIAADIEVAQQIFSK